MSNYTGRGVSEHDAAFRLHVLEGTASHYVSQHIDSCADCVQKEKLFYCVQAKRGAVFGNPILFGILLPYSSYPTLEDVKIIIHHYHGLDDG